MSRSELFATLCAVPLAASLWVASGGWAEEPPREGAGERRAAIRGEVDRLGSADRAERVAAEQALLNRGTGALPLLPGDAEVRDPAARAGLARVRKRLEERRAEESVRATEVDLRGSGTVGEVVERAGPAESDFAFTPGQAERRVDLGHERAPFWVAADDLARQAGLWPEGVDGTGRLGFRERTPEDDAKRVGYAHAFRVAAGPIGVRPVVGNEGRLVLVPIEVAAEPKVRPLFLAYAADDFVLTGDGRERLGPFTPGAKQEVPFGGNRGTAEVRLDFAAGAGLPAGPWSLSGTFRVTAAAGRETFVGFFEETRTAAGVLPVRRTESRGGVTVRFRDAVLREDGTAEVELAVVYDEGGPAFESHRAWVYHNVAELEYATEGEPGRTRLDHEPHLSTLEQRDGGVVLRYRFAGVPSGARDVRFRYVAPTKIVTVSLDVAIEGLELRP